MNVVSTQMMDVNCLARSHAGRRASSARTLGSEYLLRVLR